MKTEVVGAGAGVVLVVLWCTGGVVDLVCVGGTTGVVLGVVTGVLTGGVDTGGVLTGGVLTGGVDTGGVDTGGVLSDVQSDESKYQLL